jgi:hypothetical protein
MRTFLLKIAIWTALALGCHLIAAFFADGRTDEHYLKFTGERRSALVLGTSRAAQGIDPMMLDPLLPEDLHEPGMLNFSFNLGTSAYGPTYLKVIEKKLDPATRNGLFILCVDPWSLSVPRSIGKDGNGPFPEDERMLAQQWRVNGTPNYEYLGRNYAYGWGRMIAARWYPIESYLTLHESGWLEVQVSMDSVYMAERLAQKVADYTEHAERNYTPSDARLMYLEKTIDLLKAHGTVVVLRMPTHGDILRIEDSYWPELNSILDDLSARKGAMFMDHTTMADRFVYTDGNHMAAESTPVYSRMLAADIAALRGR